MRHTHPFLPIITMLFTACGLGGSDAPAVEVTIDGAGGRWLKLERFERNRPIPMDSVQLDSKGHGRLHVTGLQLDFYRLHLDNGKHLIVAMDSTERLEVKAQADDFDAPSEVKGSEHTLRLLEFQEMVRRYDAELDSLRGIVRQDPRNSEAMDRINQANADHYAECKAFVKENAGSPAIMSALMRLDIQRELDLFKEARASLRGPMARSSIYTDFRDQVDRLEQQEVMRRQQEEQMARLSNLLPIGGEAPDIRQNTPDGGSYALSQMRGKYVLIDFWASWCRPCRIENPHVKKIYDKYNKKGFDILGVSLDRDHNAWVQAIQQDGLPWKHVSDLGFWNNAAAQEYGVSSIPYTVLVDPEGKVVAKNLRGAALEAKLKEIFGA